MKENPSLFPQANVNNCLQQLKSYASKYKSYDDFLVDLVRKIDVNKTGLVIFVEFTQGLQNLGALLTY